MNNIYYKIIIVLFTLVSLVSSQYDSIPSNQPGSSFSEQSKKCAPPCRKGYLCVDGECVSACNPPCGSDEWCNPVTLECVPKKELNNNSYAPSTTAKPKPIKQASSVTPEPAFNMPNPILNVKPFNRGYFELTAPIGFGIYGNFTYEYNYDDDTSSHESKYRIKGDGAMSGIRIAGYGAANENAHIGGYFMKRDGGINFKYDDEWSDSKEDISIISLGLAMKFGSMIAKRVWFGFGLDVGVNFLETEDMEEDDESKLIGCETFARFCTNILILNFKGFKLSVPVNVGAIITPVSGRELYKGDNYSVKGRSFNISPVLTIGFAVGS